MKRLNGSGTRLTIPAQFYLIVGELDYGNSQMPYLVDMLERKQLMMAATVGPPKLLARNVVTFQVGRHKSPGGFTFVGRFARCEGKVEHRLAIISLPGQPVLYVQRLRVLVNVDAKEIATGIIAVLNEDARPLSRNERNVWTAAGRQIMAGAAGSPAKLHVWKTHWVNLDDRLGLVAQASGQKACRENRAYELARRQQELVANYWPAVGLRRAGEVIAESALAMVPGARHTRQLGLRVQHFSNDGVAAYFGGWPGCRSADMRWPGLVLAKLVDDVLPMALSISRIAVLQIDLGDLKIYGWLLASFVERVEQAIGCFGVGGLEALAIIRERVEGIVDAVFATVRVITLFHGSFGVELLTTCSRQVSQFSRRTECLVDAL